MSVIHELQAQTKNSGGTRQRLSRSGRSEQRAAYILLMPWFLGILGITLLPALTSLYLSFTDYSLLSPPRWSGFDNARRMLGDSRLLTSLRVTAVYVVVAVPLQLGMALAVALLLNRGLRGLSFYRSVYYLPSLLGGSVAVSLLWRQIFGEQGLVNQVLALVGIQGPGWVSTPSTALGSLVLLHVWTFGSAMVIFLAGLRQIPAMYYEAAAVDGASALRRFRSITLPLLSPIIFFNLILNIIGTFQNFTQAFVITGGGPADTTLLYAVYLYTKGFGNFQMGYASALAWLLVIIVGALTALNFVLSRYWVFYDD